MSARAKSSRRSDLDYFLDLYWSGPERRITTLTVRIISVNILALVMLAVGILFLGQYHENLVEVKLKTFKDKVDLVSAALAETLPPGQPDFTGEQTKNTVKRLSRVMQHRIMVFDHEGDLLIDSLELAPHSLAGGFTERVATAKSRAGLETLKALSRMVLQLVSTSDGLPPYPAPHSKKADDYPDAPDALQGVASMSVWYDGDGDILLSSAVPLRNDRGAAGAVLLTRKAPDIKQDISDVWTTILEAFGITLIATILLSVYLSGVIANPLKRLARAAEGVRRGHLKYTDIPDFSARRDEIGELSASFRLMTEALGKRMDSIERFAADVAHELKNPLTSLRSAVETLSVVKTDKDRKQLAGIITHDLARLNRLITDISRASRLDTELGRDILKPLSLRHILHSVLETYVDPLERTHEDDPQWAKTVVVNGKTIRLSCTQKDDLRILGFQDRLNQVFENLISNALSFSPENGAVSIRVLPSEKTIRIHVEDQGPGIPENRLEEIFERFYSQRPTHEAYGQHSGLGLFICRQIVEAVNGEIYAENIKNREGTITGARFTVILSRAKHD
ncbi:MAG: sensor histidine kinase [Alphaproteobacteria bacterium]|nr:sensor histidine kinase [Alphaproteobacteria bacterium]